MGPVRNESVIKIPNNLAFSGDTDYAKANADGMERGQAGMALRMQNAIGAVPAQPYTSAANPVGALPGAGAIGPVAVFHALSWLSGAAGLIASSIIFAKYRDGSVGPNDTANRLGEAAIPCFAGTVLFGGLAAIAACVGAGRAAAAVGGGTTQGAY